jgi:hypothetical protein
LHLVRLLRYTLTSVVSPEVERVVEDLTDAIQAVLSAEEYTDDQKATLVASLLVMAWMTEHAPAVLDLALAMIFQVLVDEPTATAMH